jgi:hypothetical protein
MEPVCTPVKCHIPDEQDPDNKEAERKAAYNKSQYSFLHNPPFKRFFNPVAPGGLREPDLTLLKRAIDVTANCSFIFFSF